MAEVSNGPVSTLPGALHALPEGTMCDTHANRPAIKRVQGETDSFGCEYYDLCQECWNKMQEEIKLDRQTPKRCEWCQQEKLNVREARDYEEGMAGRVYQVCPDCIRKQNERAEQELEESGYYDHNHDDDDFDYPENDDSDDTLVLTYSEDANYKRRSQNWRFREVYNGNGQFGRYSMGSISALVFDGDGDFATYKVRKHHKSKGYHQILLDGECRYLGEAIKRVEQKLIEIGWLVSG